MSLAPSTFFFLGIPSHLPEGIEPRFEIEVDLNQADSFLAIIISPCHYLIDDGSICYLYVGSCDLFVRSSPRPRDQTKSIITCRCFTSAMEK